MRLRSLVIFSVLTTAAVVGLSYTALRKAPVIVDYAIRQAVTTNLTDGVWKTGSVSLNFLRGRVEMTDVEISGGIDSHRFIASTPYFSAQISLTELLHGEISVKHILMRSPVIEFRKGTSKTRSRTGSASVTAASQTSASPTWHLEQFSIQNATVRLLNDKCTDSPLTLEKTDFVISNVGSAENTMPFTLASDCLGGHLEVKGQVNPGRETLTCDFSLNDIHSHPLYPWLTDETQSLPHVSLRTKGTLLAQKELTLELRETASEITHLPFGETLQIGFDRLSTQADWRKLLNGEIYLNHLILDQAALHVTVPETEPLLASVKHSAGAGAKKPTAAPDLKWHIQTAQLNNGRYELTDRRVKNGHLTMTDIALTLTGINQSAVPAPFSAKATVAGGEFRLDGHIAGKGPQMKSNFSLENIDISVFTPWYEANKILLRGGELRTQGNFSVSQNVQVKADMSLRAMKFASLMPIDNIEVNGIEFVSGTPIRLNIDEVRSRLLGQGFANITSTLTSVITTPLHLIGAEMLGNSIDSIGQSVGGDISIHNLTLAEGKLRPKAKGITDVQTIFLDVFYRIFSTVFFFF